ncbi:MAG TPA: DUF4430 domain-containing protein [Clostridiales bacterium]|nr:DUF4430 domain-containing protein [Clostridiales bacterium]
MKKLKRVFLSIIFILCLFLSGCLQDNVKSNSIMTVELRITQNLGEEVIFNKIISIEEDSTVLDVLMDNVDVETAYGGGFVNSIEGLESGFTEKKEDEKKKEDWFYFVNGIMSDIGSGEYILKSGDVIWWDYHSWDDTVFTPAVCGCFPQPFVNGYGNVVPRCEILYGKNFKEEAKNLALYLKGHGAEAITICEYNDDEFQRDDGIYIVLETSEKIADSRYWQEIMENHKKTGWFAKIDDAFITGYDISGENPRRYKDGAGAVLVSGQGMGNVHSIWLFVATEDDILRTMVKKVIDNPDNLRNMAGAIYSDGEFIPLPIR